MAHKDNVLDRMSDRMMDLKSPAYGDERERAVFMESSNFGLSIGLYVGLLGAMIAAMFGLLLLPVALVIMTILPATATHWYASRRGVNLQSLADNSGARSTMIHIVVASAVASLTFAGMAYTVFSGQPLVPLPSLDVTPGEGILGGMAQGAVIGGILGGLAGVAGGMYSYRKAKRGDQG